MKRVKTYLNLVVRKETARIYKVECSFVLSKTEN